ncbi:FTR1 family protein [Streptomyces bikiniensis]|uniref:FTR1 family protein n=1 Tax=Streptomyces bikiniensis TaxID=1896 RepID=UPI0004C15BDD|nr:FTR1 family protein [Streptomyces bikiniensis]
MYGTYLFGLREGLAAGLVVCLLAAYVVRAGRREALAPVLTGAGAAAGLSLALGAALESGSRELTPEARALVGGSLSIAAAGLVTWAVLRLRRPGPGAVGAGTGVLAAAAFLVVGREGPEASLFVGEAVRAAVPSGPGSSFQPLVWVLLGLLTAALLCLLLHRAALRAGPARFFPWAGGLLVVAGAGVLADGVRGLQEAGLLGGPAEAAFDVSAAVPPESWYGALLEGSLGLRPDPTVLQVTVWALYPVPALALLLAPIGSGPSARVKKQKATDETAEGGASAGTTS